MNLNPCSCPKPNLVFLKLFGFLLKSLVIPKRCNLRGNRREPCYWTHVFIWHVGSASAFCRTVHMDGAGGLGLLSSTLFFDAASALSAKVAAGCKGTLCNSVWSVSVLYLFKMRLPLQFNLLFFPSPSSCWSLITVLFQVHLVANDAGHHRWIHSNICCVFLGWTLNNNILWICFCSCFLPVPS